MEYTCLLTEQSNEGILKITLNRPKALNALNECLLNELMHCFTVAKKDPSIRALCLQGKGKAFCAGADIQGLRDLDAQTGLLFAQKGQAVFNILEQLEKPSIAVIHGYALGGGCELAMAASMRIAAETAQFAQPEIKLGIIPGYGGTQRLSRLVGQGRAMELCLTGRMINASEAFQMGLITAMQPEEQLEKYAEDLLKQILQYSSPALSSILTTIQQGANLALADALTVEAMHFGLLCTTTEKQAAVEKFLNRQQSASHTEKESAA